MAMSVWLIINVCLILGTQANKSKSKRPHIIFFLADDLGWNDVSFHGSRQIPTPNIDTLAANSVVLNNYYTQPLCTPSRAALMTALHPIQVGLQRGVLLGANPSGLYLNFTLLPQYFKKLGYKTDMIGKWHLGFYHKEYTPIYRGFDSHLGYWTGAMDYYNHTFYETYQNQTLPYGWGKALRYDMEKADKFNGIYATELFTKHAEKLIRSHDKSKPMFLYMAHLAIHSANKFQLFQAPKKYVNQVRYIEDQSRRLLAGMALALDKSLGKMFRALDKNGMLDNTIFVFSTDNGGEANNLRGGVGSNWPLRGNKGTTWEAGVRGVSFLWSRKFIKQMPRISEQLMSIADWLPTLYYAAGGNPEDLGAVYGENVWDALVNNTPSPRTELLHNIEPVDQVQTLRMGDYKLTIGSSYDGIYDGWYGPTGRDNGISNSEYQKRLAKCEVTKVLKRMKNFHKVTDEWLSQLNVSCKYPGERDPPNCIPTAGPCLFNVTDDPCEENNIADQFPQVVQEMMTRLQEYNQTAIPLVNQTIDPRADPRCYDDYWTTWADLFESSSCS